ncbi:MAG: glutamate racemase [Clostridium perfringens]|nr:glutamate racemase [Clostridium perfringens]
MYNIIDKNSPIGFFDSGVGGISVMKRAVELLPTENYIYFGDSKNAPYGVKNVDEVRELTFNAMKFFIEQGVKAVVIACNTATSAAIKDLRETYKEIPIIGIEPAIKPAVESKKQGKIIIMATPMTLSEKKFNNLMEKYNKEREIIKLPAPGLVEFVEDGILAGDEVREFLKEILKPYLQSEISTIVLGCTHYPFVKEVIQKIVGQNVDIIDGSCGTVKELNRKLEEFDLVNDQKEKGYVKIFNSSEDEKIIELCKILLIK